MKAQYLKFMTTGLLLFASVNHATAATAPATPSPLNSQPIRMAHLHVQALKLFKQKQANGTFETKLEKICDADGDVPVFDSSIPGTPDPSSTKAVMCKTTLKVGPANLIIAGIIALSRDVDLFGDGKKADYKMFGQTVWVQSGSYVKALPFAYSMSEDLNEKSMVVTAAGDHFGTDSKNDKVLDEQIQVIMKFEDK